MKKTIKEIKKRTVNPPCGLCGKSKKPRYKTECCGNWVCGDESEYVMFSYSRDICSRNHRRFTLCGHHNVEEHEDDWRTCKKCREDFEHELEMYVWYGMNEYNFEKLPNPPAFKPTYCSKCGERIILPDGGYSSLCGVYRCDNCPITEKERGEIILEYKSKSQDK
ncbi:MAG: hypothetical protein A2W52_01995 [Candidatus Taylorbacteria bacterium RIFCSPHIGHO2_02_49_25]|uniref:Uncharacterized protein n=1 Tax=Candidatus Taylorbacteria bacterium RIFCSPHIGHO2_02_49_25 TaxID=1802305 RepID=A0A1G2MBZ7_9BACT|nr:MAG: hypothetical protein UY62_C0016G0009 [Parcubacteria group bacterium GW2011_GWF2_50_9]OHA21455.1 MAG: hypothetical protein A2W52_01995 [Candidatus Taylorbacteria bacterium RIFCSPHIGHO2_02_49_25]OHA35865.1 MAG: hypothetical protein A3B27_03060 [Candidatus Taylorbacteria bacterium RIFCSPLOWO2_01_FULL_50_130]OHA35925.1 MAG: hypothetical protein A2W65_03945 [Candidatus Taylorbacteria bacterium RIFCSPLOWO2_02_50_13]OHA41762.1 MAG: hypothetical protein A3H73_03955 [Candidatus Taylorbacteria ba